MHPFILPPTHPFTHPPIHPSSTHHLLICLPTHSSPSLSIFLLFLYLISFIPSFFFPRVFFYPHISPSDLLHSSFTTSLFLLLPPLPFSQSFLPSVCLTVTCSRDCGLAATSPLTSLSCWVGCGTLQSCSDLHDFIVLAVDSPRCLVGDDHSFLLRGFPLSPSLAKAGGRCSGNFRQSTVWLHFSVSF